MSNRKYDWAQLEREYVSSDISLRELARRHGISSHSLVMGQSTKGKWAEKREQFRERASQSAVSLMADRHAMRQVREMDVRDKAIDVIDEAFDKLRDDMKATHWVKQGKDDEWVEVPVYRLRPQEIVMLIDRMNVIFGKPSQITEERSLGITGTMEPSALAEFIERTRGIGPVGSRGSESPIPRIDRTRKN